MSTIIHIVHHFSLRFLILSTCIPHVFPELSSFFSSLGLLIRRRSRRRSARSTAPRRPFSCAQTTSTASKRRLKSCWRRTMSSWSIQSEFSARKLGEKPLKNSKIHEYCIETMMSIYIYGNMDDDRIFIIR